MEKQIEAYFRVYQWKVEEVEKLVNYCTSKVNRIFRDDNEENVLRSKATGGEGKQ